MYQNQLTGLKGKDYALTSLSSSDKPEIGEQQVLFGAGDFSPPNADIFGTKVPCSDRYAPRQWPICHGVDQQI